MRLVGKNLRNGKKPLVELETDLLNAIEEKFSGKWGCFIGKDLSYVSSEGKCCNFEYGKTK